MIYLEHTFIWAKEGGNLDVAALQDQFFFMLAASAVAFFVIHYFVPYTPLQKILQPSLDKDQPSSIFLNFSLGQLVSYILHVIGLPVLVLGLFPYGADWPLDETATKVAMFVGVVVFYILPSFLEGKIDNRLRRSR